MAHNEREPSLEQELERLRQENSRLKAKVSGFQKLIDQLPIIYRRWNEDGVLQESRGGGLKQIDAGERFLVGNQIDFQDPVALKQFKRLQDGEMLDYLLYEEDKDDLLHERVFESWILKADGEQTEFVGMCYDVSQLYNEAQDAQDQLDDFERLIESTPDILYVYDIVKNETLYASSSLLTKLGYLQEGGLPNSSNEIMHADLIHPADKEHYERHLHGLIQPHHSKSKSAATVEYRMRSENGEWRCFQSRDAVFRLQTNGQVRQIVGLITDITEKKQLDDRYREQQAFLGNVLNASPSIVYTLDLNSYQITFINRAVTRLLGYTQDEILAMEAIPDQLISDASRPKLQEHLNQLNTVPSDDATSLLKQFKHKDGTLRWFLSRDIVYKVDADGSPAVILCALQDVNELMEAQNAAEEQRRFNEKITQSVPGILRLTNVNTLESHYLSRQHLEITGLDEDAFRRLVVEAEIEPQIHPEDWSKLMSEFIPAIKSAGDSDVIHSSYRWRHPVKEEWIWLALYATVFERDKDGHVLRYVSVAVDETETREMAMMLERRNRFVERIANILPGLLYVYDPRNDEMIFSNDGLKRMLGYEQLADDAPFLNYSIVQTFMHPDDTPRGLQQFQILKDSEVGEVANWTYRMRAANGEWRWFESADTTFMRDANGRITQILGVAFDVTDKMVYAAQLEMERHHLAERSSELAAVNAELARATRMKDEFLANMSHELRTPLNLILGMAEVLRLQIYGDLSAAQLKPVTSIEKSGKHLLELINDILDLSKIEAGELNLIVDTISLESVCQDSIYFVKQQAAKKDIQIHVNFDPSVRFLDADPLRLKQILVNLLSNAVKFTPNQGQVGIEYIGFPNLKRIDLTVWDTGIGIAAEDQARLFEPFVQATGHLSRQHEGTGLGLSLVYRLVEMHGGSISLQSDVDEGSRFTVSLPWTPMPGQLELSDTLNGENYDAFAYQHVIMIDQSLEDAHMLRRMLQQIGVATILHAEEAKALDQIDSFRPDVIFVEVSDLENNGDHVLHKISAGEYSRNVPVVAYAWLAMREVAKEAGAAAFLPKPITPQKIADVLGSIQLTKGLQLQSAATLPEENQQVIFIVDDNRNNIDMLKGYFEKMQYHIIDATNGPAALELLRQSPPDIMLVDVQMPGMDGYELIRRIRQLPGLANLPIIVITAFAMVGDRERALKAGADDYFSKPVSLQMLHMRLSYLLRMRGDDDQLA